MYQKAARPPLGRFFLNKSERARARKSQPRRERQNTKTCARVGKETLASDTLASGRYIAQVAAVDKLPELVWGAARAAARALNECASAQYSLWPHALRPRPSSSCRQGDNNNEVKSLSRARCCPCCCVAVVVVAVVVVVALVVAVLALLLQLATNWSAHNASFRSRFT